MSRFFKSAAFPILIVVVLAFFVQKLVSPHSSEPVPSYGDFITQLEAGQVKTVDIKTKDNTIVVKPRTGAQYERGFLPDNAPSLESRLEKAKAAHQIDDYNIEGTKSNGWLSLLTYVLPFLIFIGFWIFLMNQVQGGGSKVMSFGKSRAKRMSVDSPKITFRDVAGVDEAVETSFWTKNARTTTMRIGKAALLKNRLMKARIGGACLAPLDLRGRPGSQA